MTTTALAPAPTLPPTAPSTPCAAAVERGAAFLDRARPGWDESIDLGELNMRLVCCCVLGQLGASYHSGARHVGLDPFGLEVLDLGFVTEAPDEGAERERRYDELTAAWRDEILRRRAHELV